MAITNTAVPAPHDFEFTDADFQRIRALIYARAGISLAPGKRQMVYSRIARRLRALGMTRFDQYLACLDEGDPQELEAFTNALTTNLTAFFREKHHFPVLAAHARAVAQVHPLTLWCAGCSTGEEPYSMAMTAVDALGSAAPPVRILATDVDTTVLARAQEGVYPLDRLESLPPGYARKFFLRGTGARAGYARVRPELQSLITFRQINLLDPVWPIRGPLDAIFCRNVMIYFDKPTQRKILEKFVPLLREDGLLFAGHSESLHHSADLLKLRGKTVYEVAPRARDGHA